MKIEKNEIFFSSEELIYFKNKFSFYNKKFAIINPVSKTTYTTVKSWGFKKYQKLVNSHDIMWIQVGMINDPILKNALNTMSNFTNNLNLQTSILQYINQENYYLIGTIAFILMGATLWRVALKK